MDMTAREQYLETLRGEYRRGTRKQKTRLLNEAPSPELTAVMPAPRPGIIMSQRMSYPDNLYQGRGGHASAEPIRGIVHNPPQPLTGEPCCALLHLNTHWRS